MFAIGPQVSGHRCLYNSVLGPCQGHLVPVTGMLVMVWVFGQSYLVLLRCRLYASTSCMSFFCTFVCALLCFICSLAIVFHPACSLVLPCSWFVPLLSSIVILPLSFLGFLLSPFCHYVVNWFCFLTCLPMCFRMGPYLSAKYNTMTFEFMRVSWLHSYKIHATSVRGWDDGIFWVFNT